MFCWKKKKTPVAPVKETIESLEEAIKKGYEKRPQVREEKRRKKQEELIKRKLEKERLNNEIEDFMKITLFPVISKAIAHELNYVYIAYLDNTLAVFMHTNEHRYTYDSLEEVIITSFNRGYTPTIKLQLEDIQAYLQKKYPKKLKATCIDCGRSSKDFRISNCRAAIEIELL